MRRGFTLMEVLVALLVIVVLSAVLIPTLSKQIRGAEAAVLAQDLQQISSAIYKFRQDNGFYPHQLSQLTTRPGLSSNLNSCQITVSSTFATWNGPYVSFQLTSDGLQIGDAEVNDLLSRNPSDNLSPNSASGLLVIDVADVHKPIAQQVDSLIDGTFNLTVGAGAGSVTFQGGSPGNIGTLSFSIPIRDC